MSKDENDASVILHRDSWDGIDQQSTIAEKVRFIHSALNQHMPFVSRIAVALYDPNTDYVRTFVYSSEGTSPLNQYLAKLKDCYSLTEIARERCPRVVHDLNVFDDSEHKHTKVILESGYRSSYTFPMFWERTLFGFVFFNANEPSVFAEHCLHELDSIGHMLTLLVYNEVANVRTLIATVKSALDMSHSRDPETGFHLERMAHYSRMTAQVIAPKHGFDDHFIEYIYLFAPLHDIGKLAIPDRILLKEGPLSKEEYEEMKTHAQKGKDIIDRLLCNYGLDGVTHVEVLRNIALHHHEAYDGSGYPMGLQGEEIPIEARIVCVADIFDALTSHRPYKDAWSNEEAYTYLRDISGTKLDSECVQALLSCNEQLCEVQSLFKEDEFG